MQIKLCPKCKRPFLAIKECCPSCPAPYTWNQESLTNVGCLLLMVAAPFAFLFFWLFLFFVFLFR